MNQKSFSVAFAIALLVAFAAASNPITDLTDSTFESYIADKELAIVKFYASWCPHSKALAPNFEQAARTYANRIYFAQVDAPENQQVAEKYKVDAYPTIYVFRNGEYIEYHGARSVKKLTEFFERELLTLVTPLTTVEQAKSFAASDDVVVIGNFRSEQEQEYAEFAQVARGYRQEMRFGYFSDAAIMAEFGISASPAIIMFKKFDEPRHDFDGEYTSDKIDHFVTIYSIPLFDEVHPDNYRFYADSGLPLVLFFLDPNNKSVKEDIAQFILPISAKYREKLTFAWIDGPTYAAFGRTLGLHTEEYPAALIQSFDPSARYVFEGTEGITSDSISNWLSEYLLGRIEPHVRSEQIPEQNDDEPVTIVVGDSYEDVVINSDSDVFVEFYAPWCGHCKALAPIWEELAEVVSEYDNLVIAKIDATANDVAGIEVQGYPTLFYYSAKNKQTPVEYEGDRTLEDLLNFIKENASFDFTIPDLEAEEEGEDGEEGDDGEEEYDD
eukprot:TRINITY_DN808_c0_g1_i1.p1 TRINITY_DN808_c0_g1~~TRINITY_DN808_c0_g1_i1.p1  ORF type:complete len:498 (-),score=115.39 TRINITY_DN808_c0_g1_i1:230-1723(-)